MAFISLFLWLFFLSLTVMDPALVVDSDTSVSGEVTILVGCRGPLSLRLVGDRGLVNLY